MEDNISLKHRLSEIIARQLYPSDGGLDVLEAFMNSFVNKDAHISLLRQDVRNQQKEALLLSPESAAAFNFHHKQQKLQYDVLMMSEQCARLKTAFEDQFAPAGVPLQV